MEAKLNILVKDNDTIFTFSSTREEYLTLAMMWYLHPTTNTANSRVTLADNEEDYETNKILIGDFQDWYMNGGSLI